VGAESLFQMQVIGVLGMDFVKTKSWQQEKNWNWILRFTSVASFQNSFFFLWK